MISIYTIYTYMYIYVHNVYIYIHIASWCQCQIVMLSSPIPRSAAEDEHSAWPERSEWWGAQVWGDGQRWQRAGMGYPLMKGSNGVQWWKDSAQPSIKMAMFFEKLVINDVFQMGLGLWGWNIQLYTSPIAQAKNWWPIEETHNQWWPPFWLTNCLRHWGALDWPSRLQLLLRRQNLETG
jgi:hypothetical protein